jgi:hypothetical protein
MRSPLNATVAYVILIPFLFTELPCAMEGEPVGAAVSQEEYELYDRVIEDKFLTSQIRLVLLERMTVSRLVPNQPESMTMGFFQQEGFFQGMLPQDLVRDFVGSNHARSPLEGRFRLGVRYRFVSDDPRDEPEANRVLSVRNHDHLSLYSPTVLDRLALSRVGRTVRNDQALVYVENVRPDGTGAGFLVWCHRRDGEWEIFDTEVVWTMRGGESSRP